MNILAIETSTEACSVALSINNEIHELYEVAPRGHGDLVLSMIDRLLSEAGLIPAQLDLVGFGRGPGAFTGVRIATSVAQGIAFALDIPVVPVSTLAVLAHGAFREHGKNKMICAMDARMGEVYCSAYEMAENNLVEVVEERVCTLDDVPQVKGLGWYGVGSGWEVHAEELGLRYSEQCMSHNKSALPRAYDVVVLAALMAEENKAVSAEAALPVYLRDKVV